MVLRQRGRIQYHATGDGCKTSGTQSAPHRDGRLTAGHGESGLLVAARERIAPSHKGRCGIRSAPRGGVSIGSLADMFTQILVAIGLVVALLSTRRASTLPSSLMISRTPQAAIGWGLRLVICPYVAIPLFLIFGESRFSGYALAGQDRHEELDAALRQAQRAFTPFRTSF